MTTYNTNQNAANVLLDIATILEHSHDNPYRIRAYRRAARLILLNKDDARLHLTSEGELDLPGLGVRLRRKIGDLLSTGRMGFYVELFADLPDEIRPLLLIPGVGPRTALRLHEELGIGSASYLVEAGFAGKIRQLYGFGVRREEILLRGARDVLAGRLKTPAPIEPEFDDSRMPVSLHSRRPTIEQLELPHAA